MLGFGRIRRCFFVVAIGGVASAQHVISRGGVDIGVHPLGLVASLPRDGLRTYDGPLVELAAGFAEWYGLAYERTGQAYSGVAEGVERDWANREPIELVSFDGTRDYARSVARLHDARITTTFSFDPDGPYVLVDVDIRNTSRRTLRNIIYTREWRCAGEGGWSWPVDLPLPIKPTPDIARDVWMLDDLPPGEHGGVVLSFATGGSNTLLGIDVPLSLWTSPSFPTGVTYGAVYGISWGDYDGDDYPDVFCTQSKRLWRNVGGSDWNLAATLNAQLPNTTFRYGCAFGDWDANGVQDFATAPRATTPDARLHMLRNDGNTQFHDIVIDPTLVDVVPFGNAETLCWGDVDGDKRLDLFVPVYPAWAFNGPGNFFLYNVGPAPSGEFAFREQSAIAGLDNPTGSSRPEGAQFVDLDGDGDLDLFSNGTLYRNRSTPGTARFDPQTPLASGIAIQTLLDEGAQIFDYDLDGDFDLACAYTSSPGVVIWEARGDGTFFQLENGVIQSPLTGLTLGLSAEDWDNDGDLDFTTRQVFRRNMLVETGARGFVVAQHAIPSNHITNATPAWADWDKDGDLDCALGNWGELGRFYYNSTYDASTPMEARRYLRVRPVMESFTVAKGLDVEYGAAVEVRVRNAPDAWRRRKFTSSSAGYLNQNEYPLHFALPADPTPSDPTTDLELDLRVDYPVVQESAPWRVDHHVNPALANVALASLTSREIKVFRRGEIVIDGISIGPMASVSPQLVATAGGLVSSGVNTAIPAVVAAPNANTWVALEVRVPAGGRDVLVDDIVIDGQLAAPFTCNSGSYNLVAWDFTNPAHPVRVASQAATTSTRNSRTSVPWDLRLTSGHVYRIAAHVTSYRATDANLPVDHGNLQVIGTAFYTDTEPCNSSAIAVDPTDDARVYFALLFHR